MNFIEVCKESELTEKKLVAITRLLYDVFVTDGRTFEEVLAAVKERMASRKGSLEETIKLVVWDQEEPVAHAGYFCREIYTQAGSIFVGALTGVCVRKSHRGKGLGRRVVKAYFDQIDQGVFSVGLWQTEVPDFYARLGARIISNPFFNSQNSENPHADPWPGEVKMIYPPDYPWPEGVIDLNGHAY